ncbi:MAG: hypothetical protein J5872_01875 [Lachnospiraceae bacterium]|nr:hypothetical protein [Lachnospiraceae bacterium]
MKDFLKKESVLFVPSSIMFLMALFMLELFMCFGIISKNKGLVVTIIYMFLFTMVIMIVVLLSMSGKALLTHLRDENYYRIRKEAGDGAVAVYLKLTALYSLILALLGGLYLLMLGLDILWSAVAFPEEKAGITKIWTTLFPGPNNASAVVSAVLELFLIAFLFTALSFFCVTMAFNLFTKTRYAGILAAVFFMMIGYAVVKLNIELLGKLEPVTVYHLASAAFCAVIGAFLTAASFGSIRKRNWNTEQ